MSEEPGKSRDSGYEGGWVWRSGWHKNQPLFVVSGDEKSFKTEE